MTNRPLPLKWRLQALVLYGGLPVLAVLVVVFGAIGLLLTCASYAVNAIGILVVWVADWSFEWLSAAIDVPPWRLREFYNADSGKRRRMSGGAP